MGYLAVAGAEGIKTINPDAFASTLAGLVYAAALTLKKQGKPVQAFSLIAAIEGNPHWLRLANSAATEVGLPDWRDVLVHADSTTAHNARGVDLVNEWLADIAEAAQRRASVQIGADLQSAEISPQEAIRRLQEVAASSPADRAGVELHTIADLVKYKAEEDPTTLLGRRWVCQGGQLLLVGQSGIGKSSLTVQAAMTWALGMPFFGIAPQRPLKSLYIQAENDAGDMAEVVQGVLSYVVTKSGKTPAEALEMLNDNLVMVRSTAQTGEEFTALVSDLIQQHGACDLVFADPLLSFIGDDVSQQSVASHFLRELCNPIAFRHKFAWVFSHHTGKPQSDSKARAHWNASDYAYIGLGSSELTNWARAIAVLQTTKQDDTFKLLLAKRGARAGIADEHGLPATSVILQHGSHGLYWEPGKLDEDESAEGSGSAGRKPKLSPADVAQIKFDYSLAEDKGKFIAQAKAKYNASKTTIYEAIKQN